MATGDEKFPCPCCGKPLLPTGALKVRVHRSGVAPETSCPGSGRDITVPLDPDGLVARNAPPWRLTEIVEEKAAASAAVNAAFNPAPAETAPWVVAAQPTPAEFFADPPKAKRRTRQPLEGAAAELAAYLKETFSSYQDSRERSMQTTIGPSEVGEECNRKLAYKLAGVPRSNVRDSWAAFVGTQVHRGLEDVFRWADGGRDRFLVNHRVQVAPPLIPSGTLDRADRTLSMVIDDKTVGASSLSKLWLDGPSRQQRVQLMCYAMGMEDSGERFDRVALVGWPRAENLDHLYVHVEPYDRVLAEDAITRLAAIDARLRSGSSPAAEPPSASFACRFCDYHRPGAPLTDGGCPG